MRYLFIISLLLLSSCNKNATLTFICPSIITYSNEQQKALSNELKSLPSNSNISQFLRDYSSLREQVRQCEK